MSFGLVVEPLSAHTALVPVIASWLQREWPDWYGPAGQGNAQDDLRRFACGEHTLPLGVVAFRNGIPCGFAALKDEAVPLCSGLMPWAGAGFVLPDLRGQGIGALLLRALVREAKRLGFAYVYCGTSTANSLLLREGWHALEVVVHGGKELTVFQHAT